MASERAPEPRTGRVIPPESGSGPGGIDRLAHRGLVLLRLQVARRRCRLAQQASRRLAQQAPRRLSPAGPARFSG